MAVIEAIQESTCSQPQPLSTSRAPLPKPPPRSGDFSYAQPSDGAPRDLESTLKSWDSVPLFMKDLGSGSSEAANDTALEALQSLAFDGSPDEVASNFKSQANDYFKAKRYREALGFYTQAIDANPADQTLLETLHANRAACHLELQNYGATLRDTSKVLGLNANNEKAYYRAIKALLALDRYQDAIECAKLGLKVNAANSAIASLKLQAEQKHKLAQTRQEENAERKRRQDLLSKALQNAFLVRGLWLETTPRPPDNPQAAHFDVQSLRGTASDPEMPLTTAKAKSWTPPDVIRTPLVLPVFFIYPQHAQSDLITDYHEDTPLSSYLSTMFPTEARGSLRWDVNAEYYDTNLQVYATTRKHRLLKLGRKLCLREIMDQAFQQADPAKGEHAVRDRDGLIMRDGILSLVVLPKGNAEQAWVQKFKADRQTILNK